MKKRHSPPVSRSCLSGHVHGRKVRHSLDDQDRKTGEYEGRQLPLVTVDISSLSHPFFTGKQKFIDTAGRVEKFQKKYNWDKREKK